MVSFMSSSFVLVIELEVGMLVLVIVEDLLSVRMRLGIGY
jgi:hypothetical protein